MHVYTPFTNENPFTAITTTITHEKKKTLIFQIVDLTLIFMHKTSQNIFQMTNLIFLEFSFHAAEWEFKWDTITFCERFFSSSREMMDYHRNGERYTLNIWPATNDHFIHIFGIVFECALIRSVFFFFFTKF